MSNGVVVRKRIGDVLVRGIIVGFMEKDFVNRLNKVGFPVNELVQTANNELSDFYTENALLHKMLNNVNSKLSEVEKVLNHQVAINKVLPENDIILNNLIAKISHKVDNARWEISDPRI